MAALPNPDSFLQTDGRVIELMVHRCLWSGLYSENSPLAIEECARENVLRGEIDVQLCGMANSSFFTTIASIA
jgi:hypothetical protein